jgi:hypothetical protein
MSFHEWLVTAWQNLLSWFGVEEQKLASLMYPIFKDAKSLIQKDLLKDIIAGLPIITAALAGNGVSAAIIAAEQFIVPLLTQQGIELATTTINTLANVLVAQAQASLPKDA